MGKISTIVKVATVAGPAILKMIQTYGPQLREIAANNPEVLTGIKRKITASNRLGAKKFTLPVMQERIAVLKDQVTYLYASANTPAVAKRASAWRSELDALENTLPILGAMSKNAQNKELAIMQTRIDKLSSDILAATITDNIEDAQTE